MALLSLVPLRAPHWFGVESRRVPVPSVVQSACQLRCLACFAVATTASASLARSRAPRHATPMLYHAYQTHADLLGPLRTAARRAAALTGRASTSGDETPRYASWRPRCEVLRAAASRTCARRSASIRCTSASARSPCARRRCHARRSPRCCTSARTWRDRRGPPRADRRADVRPLRHAAARHRAHDARRPRRLHHRLAQRARRAAARQAASASTSTSST